MSEKRMRREHPTTGQCCQGKHCAEHTPVTRAQPGRPADAVTEADETPWQRLQRDNLATLVNGQREADDE